MKGMNKYVMFERVHPAIFFEIKHRFFKESGNITSAGFFNIVDGQVVTGGESLSLNGMKPAPKDAEIIQRFLEDGGLL